MAFKRHRLSNKRTLKEKIKNFNHMMEREDHLPLTRRDSGDHTEKNADLNRNISNSSVDSMDMVLFHSLFNQ